MEEGVKDINDEGQNEGKTTDSDITKIDEGKGVNNKKVGENVDLDEFYDIYDNEDKNITEYSIVWVNTNKTIWEGRIIKIPFSDVPEDPKHLKIIWVNTKK